MRTMTVQPKMTDDEVRQLAGQMLPEDSYDFLAQDE